MGGCSEKGKGRKEKKREDVGRKQLIKRREKRNKEDGRM
jgi:hypothetical protein